jgi:hypothetical protein
MKDSRSQKNLKTLVEQKLSAITMYLNAAKSDTVEVTVSTLALIHQARESKAVFREQSSRLPNATKERHFYYMNGFIHPASERPTSIWNVCGPSISSWTKCSCSRGMLRSMLSIHPLHGHSMRPVRETACSVWVHPRGAVMKLFHYICKDVVDGNRQ